MQVVNGINNAFASIAIPNLFGMNVSGTAGVSGANVSAAAGAGTAPKPKPSQVEKFAGGGIATGSSSGYLAMLHGTEGVFTREQMAMLSPAGGGGVTVNLTYAPAFSTASADELEKNLMPFIIRGVRLAGKNI
jgi:hypothetical protein